MVEKYSEGQVVTDILLELQFLPCLEYFAGILQYGTLKLEACENLPRRSPRNRCRVLTANKVDTLTVPLKESRRALPIRDVKIDYGQPWVRRHWGCLQSAYGQSPYFEHYAPDFEAVYERAPAFLFDFNQELLTLCLRFLGIGKEITYTLSYETAVKKTVFDARSLINPRNSDETVLFYQKIPYYQTFGNDFVPNLSIIDLLFNQGPESPLILRQSAIWPQSA
ncbi:WbqC family protein [Persicitalea sp.]|uniref:WbqC family protein n=1 Tax=Persicitalea sp. TaxID=3100273 RepID=UPI003593CAE7